MTFLNKISTAPFLHWAQAGVNFQFVPCDEDLLAIESQSKSATSLTAATS